MYSSRTAGARMKLASVNTWFHSSLLEEYQLCTCLHEAVADLSIDCAQVVEGLLALAVVIVEKEPQVEDIASYWVDAVDSADAVTLVLTP